MNNTTYFFDDIKEYGREIDTQITSSSKDLSVYDINSFQPRFNCSLFQTVMRVLEVDSNYLIKKGSYVSGLLGVKFNRDDFEYISYDNYYISEEPEYDEDTKAYVFKAYDRMIEAMIDYDLEVNYPISVRDFIIAICDRLNWDTSGIPETFINSTTNIDEDVYTGCDYTFRDVLDEIAKITCSFPGFYNGVFSLKYITETNVTVTNDYLSEDDLTFEKEYYINSVVFSRVDDSDTYYKRDNTDIGLNGLHEYRLSDLQILSTDSRSNFMDEMYEYLRELKFWIFDIKTTGIFIFDIADRFTIQTDDNSYSVVCLNSEGKAEQGLEEYIYAEEPEESETDYKSSTADEKADRTTKIIVDKINQKITATVEEVSSQNTKISEISQTVDKLNQSISDIADITTSEAGYGSVSLENVNENEPVKIIIRPTSGDDVALLYPRNTLYPSDTLYPVNRILRFATDDYTYDYLIPDDLYYYDDDNYDEFILDYATGTCSITKKVAYDDDGNKYLLDTSVTTDYDYPTISLEAGDYKVSLLGYPNAYLFVRLTTANIYTTQFATKVELNSAITQTTESILSSVSATYVTLSNLSSTVTNLESEITQSASSILSTVSQSYASLDDLDNLSETLNSTIEQTAESITSTVSTKVGEDEIISKINQSSESVTIQASKVNLEGYVTLSSLSESESTTIDGSNITTGILKSSNYEENKSGTSINLSTGVIDTAKFKVSEERNNNCNWWDNWWFYFRGNKFYNKFQWYL